MQIPPAFDHQVATTKFVYDNPRVFITSDPGTGKTRSIIDAFSTLLAENPAARLLVLAPLSIVQASWGDDIEKFAPSVTYSIAYARNREKAFTSPSNVVITNHDAAKWMLKNRTACEQFDMICIDESTAFKNASSQRSKALAKVINNFDRRVAMSGTPNSNTVCDVWHQLLLVDDGERLGTRFYSFRANVCTSQFNGFANVWADKPEAQDMVGAAIKDINVRYQLEDCIDMPEQSFNTMYVDLPQPIRKQYETLLQDSVLYTGTGTINAVHAGARVKKLLQLCTGAIYDNDGSVLKIHGDRYELVTDLIEQRDCSLVAFNWRHEREELTRLAEKRGIKYEVIDGSTPAEKRADIVARFQAGHLQVIYAHPQSTSHGLTLTRATTIIWASPTYNSEHYVQFNRRIYRAGQTKKTEVIRIAARDTWEMDVYDKLGTKVSRMEDLLSVLSTMNELRKPA